MSFPEGDGKPGPARAVVDFEARTAAELVVVVEPRAGHYLHVGVVFGALAAVLGLAFLLYGEQSFALHWFIVDPVLVGLLAGWLGSGWSPIERALTPARRRAAGVLRAGTPGGPPPRPARRERGAARFPRAGCCVVAAQGECPIGVPDIEPGHVAQPLILTVFRPVDVPPGQVAVGIAHHAAFGDLQFLIQAVIEFGGETVADQQIDGQRIGQEHGAKHQREGGGEPGAQGQPTPGCDHGACS